MTIEGIQIVDVWRKANEQDKSDVRGFWIDQGAIQDNTVIEQRLPQLCVLARSGDGQLLGVTTVFEQYNEQLKNRFFNMRMFVGSDARRERIGFGLIHKLIETLESRFVSGEYQECIGVLFELENDALKKARNEAIWPTTGFVYVGNNARGDHVRVRYFKGARITV